MCYSLGNYLFEIFVSSPVFTSETKLLDNVLLTQADVDAKAHLNSVQNLVYANRVYLTVNEDDDVLKWSDKVNPARLGSSTKYLNADDVTRFDSTDGRAVGDAHGLFYKTAKRNQVVKEISLKCLTSGRTECAEGIVYNPKTNAYELAD